MSNSQQAVWRSTRWRPSTGAVRLLVVGVACAAGGLVLGAPVSGAEPGSPGTPQEPTPVFAEDFEYGMGVEQVLLSDYTGAPPTSPTYTADEPWLTRCNGMIVQFPTPVDDLGNCASTTSTANTRQLAYGLGEHSGQGSATNHAVTAYTEGDPGADLVEFETVAPVPLASENGRFLTFSVDTAAVNCAVSPPLYQFYLLDGDDQAPVGGEINACTSTTTVNAPAVGALPARDVNVGTYTSDGSVLFTGSSLGIRMTNANGSGAGNDAAFDNIRVLDVSPQLDKSFSETSVPTGGTSTLTFTITNTSELAAKNGWSFTDNLSDGLTVADPANATIDCPGGAVTADPGSGSVVVTGDLDSGMASCTASVDVTSGESGSFTNGPDNIECVGCDPPGDAVVEFSDPTYSVEKTASATEVEPGETVEYALTVRNTGEFDYTEERPASVSDDLTSVLDDAVYNDDAAASAGPAPGYAEPTLSWSGPLAVGETVTITYSVTVNDPATGDGSLDNVVTTPEGNGGDCPEGTDDPRCGTTTTVDVPPGEDEPSPGEPGPAEPPADDTKAPVPPLRHIDTGSALAAAEAAGTGYSPLFTWGVGLVLLGAVATALLWYRRQLAD
ncbi:DUF7933 domain-containing protein [Prauserella cavernicola]|uniref:DUF11 domain-containing protein n=1 Tax=Prauserella cavernicola TaxID=2800127 RepID=A0A934QS44_9PSEU|nr:DUF11 domain-containing protein [Prauserella cavernicola]MBK1787222.1 DUF11 domain-containing protein [Prauserella cavernicola]